MANWDQMMNNYSSAKVTKSQITVSIGTNDGAKKLKQLFISTHTIYDVKIAYRDDVNPNINLDKMVLRHRGKACENNKQLSSLNIKRNRITLLMSTSCIGGSKYGGSSRKIDNTDGDIKIVNSSCSMLLINLPCAKMSCGCKVSADGMYGWIKRIYGQNETNYKIICPVHKSEWDWDLCCSVAGMTDDEYDQWDYQYQKRSTPATRQCPNSSCKSECEKPNGLKMFRINCPQCSGSDWCWECAKPWVGGGFIVCGNSGCQTEEINIVLANCPEKSAAKGVKIPEVRACPGCYKFIEHDSECKHMTCPQCSKKFCFACLGVYSGGWPCGGAYDQCSVAPRQKLK